MYLYDLVEPSWSLKVTQGETTSSMTVPLWAMAAFSMACSCFLSPEPLTPRAIRRWFASTAPVATDGMRPWTALKLCERPMKYAGLFDEQPMPLGLITRSGGTPISYMASMMRSEIALWPQPAHKVVLPPR